METIDALRRRIPAVARDIKLNLESVLQSGGPLSDSQRWGTAVAAAFASRSPELARALLAGARAADVAEESLEDARAAAALMAMSNVYYRFRHLVGKDVYSRLPARLRMGRMAQPASSKLDFELYSLAVSAINGCEVCVRAHESVVSADGLSEEAVHEAIRVAAVIHAAAVALELEVPRNATEDAASF